MTSTDRPSISTLRSDPGYAAFFVLRSVFVVAPILFGLDKFFNLMTDWPHYLVPWIDTALPGDAQTGMYIIGVIEIVAGLLVAVAPRIGAWVVSLWLAGIIVNLVTFSAFYTLSDYDIGFRMYDVALRDFGLLIGAVALGLLANKYAANTIGLTNNHKAVGQVTTSATAAS
ncbi:hypothetical protein [Tomitella biformata]|uniref:hypothetical protein n=1 Tax=Tomitella biformata TaxID=630403 RepID=UPI000466B1AB|nr:hypothetical protein [Tomitella biformata]